MPYSNDTLVRINPDTTLSVFLSMYHCRIQLALELHTLYTKTNTLVRINSDTTLSVFLSMMYQCRYNSLSNSIYSLHEI